MSKPDQNTVHPVIIIGGGPVGISTALELAFHGIRSLVLEKRPRDSEFPMRANLVNLRSMEHFRRWGIADRLRANDPIGAEFQRSSTWVTHLDGHVVYDFPSVFEFADVTALGSDRPEWIPNDAIERTLQDAAVENPKVDIRFGCDVTDFDQDSTGVTVTYLDADNVAHHVRGAYAVGADGSRSFVRKKIGMRMDGVSNVAVASIWHIEAPGLMARSTVGKSSFCWFINELRDSCWIIVQDSRKERYCFMLLPIPDGFDPDDWDAIKQVIYRNVGFELPIENLGGGRVGIHSLIAPQFHVGRVFLAGDAAHLISPMGGFGLNLGVGDAVDLGWKLAATLNGWGGAQLLPSYGTERSTAIKWIQEECIDNTVTLAPELAEDGMSDNSERGRAVREKVAQRIFETKAKEFESYGAQLGYRYDGSPIIMPDGSVPPPLSMGQFTPSAFPGCRAPHVWLPDGHSLFDMFGPEFTLLKLDAAADTAALEAAAKMRDIPLKVVTPQADLASLYGARLALIRPDQHVAWRGDAAPADALGVIDIVRGA